MNLESVAGELAAALRTIDGLNVPEWGVQRVHPPFALVPMPERVTYDNTYQRGRDVIEDWPVLVLVANPAKPEARRAVTAYADGSGPKSVKQAIESHTYTALTAVRVASVDFDVVSYAGPDYLAAMFHLEISGEGARP